MPSELEACSPRVSDEQMVGDCAGGGGGSSPCLSPGLDQLDWVES